MSKQDKKFCPIILAQALPGDDVTCQKEECAWWDAAEENCAVLVLAQATKSIDYRLPSKK